MEAKKFIMGKNGYFHELYITPEDLSLLLLGDQLLVQIDSHTLYVQMRKNNGY